MRILLIGSGGRESALARALTNGYPCQPDIDHQLLRIPNPGVDSSYYRSLNVEVDDHDKIIELCHNEKIDLVVIGPEQPLANGIVDHLSAAGIIVFGPSKAAAQLESSKSFAKDICRQAGVATAAYHEFTNKEAALEFAQSHDLPLVIKADGLAAGKGVTIAEDLKAAEIAIEQYFTNNKEQQKLLIEEYLTGVEVSFFAICDGLSAIPLTSAHDYKRVFDDNKGPNTGGMGAFSPSPLIDDARQNQIINDIITPVITVMHERGTPFTGTLYAGLIITDDGIKVIEFNVRFGDPECQVIMPRFNGDLANTMRLAATGLLTNKSFTMTPTKALTIVYAAKGYPGAYTKGETIYGLDAVTSNANITLDYAGAKQDITGKMLTSGGRVLNVTATAPTLEQARTHAYQAIDKINWPGGFYRHDIGLIPV